MANHNTHLTGKHMLVCVAIVLVVLAAVLAGASSGLLILLILCPLMMGAMMLGMGSGRDERH